MFTLIHPSRGRARQAFNTMINWLNKSSSKDIQYIFSLDNDDKQLNFYHTFLKGIPESLAPEIIISENKNLVQALQRVKPEAIKGDIIIVVSDDFDCPLNWDKLLLNISNGRTEFAIKINDGITKADNPIMTLPILSRELYLKLGYIYYPGYIGMYADNDLFEACEKLGAIIHAPQLLFQHNHWVNGRARRDETHGRHDNPISWKIGKQLFEQRRQRNFDLA